MPSVFPATSPCGDVEETRRVFMQWCEFQERDFPLDPADKSWKARFIPIFEAVLHPDLVPHAPPLPPPRRHARPRPPPALPHTHPHLPPTTPPPPLHAPPAAPHPPPGDSTGSLACIPHGGARITTGRPICSILARGVTADGCRDILKRSSEEVYRAVKSSRLVERPPEAG